MSTIVSKQINEIQSKVGTLEKEHERLLKAFEDVSNLLLKKEPRYDAYLQLHYKEFLPNEDKQ